MGNVRLILGETASFREAAPREMTPPTRQLAYHACSRGRTSTRGREESINHGNNRSFQKLHLDDFEADIVGDSERPEIGQLESQRLFRKHFLLPSAKGDF